jgi:dihydropyrimidine dehydrogenase (NAD+) subunit PreA
MEESQMVDLSVNFAGVTFKNPIVMASMVFGWSGEALKKAGLAGASGVVCKSIGSPVETFEHPRCGRMVLYRHNGIPIGMQNNEIFSTTNVDEWIARELKIAAEGGARQVVSIVANPKASDTADMARKVARTGLVDIFELNVSCPMPAAGVGMNIGKVPELSAEQVRAVKNACPDIPLMPKMTPNVSDIAAVAKACEEAGADAIAATNSVQALIGVDVETGVPLLPAFGGYSGPVVHPIMLRCVAQIAQAVKIPIAGIGGVSNWKQAVEMMMVGATMVQVGTAIIWNGYRVVGEMVKGIESFMERKGYQSPHEFIGMALKHLTTTEEMAMRPPKVCEVELENCIACGVCAKVCGYEAIEIQEDRKPKFLVDKCDGCGLCAQFCPTSMITLVDKAEAKARETKSARR